MFSMWQKIFAKSGLKIHIVSVHEKKNPFTCLICDQKLSAKIHIARHNSSVHEGKKPYKCSVCDESFSSICK